VKQTGDLPVPLHLRNAPTKMMKNMDYGKNYKYAHSFENNFTEQEFFPETLSGTTLYEPQPNPAELITKAHLKELWKGKYGY